MKRNSVANDNDYTNVEPAEKSVRKLDVEDPSFEVLELRQKVAKLEKDFQGACRIANEYEKQLQEYKSRVESLENLLDAKPVMASSEEANELMRQLDESRNSLEAAHRVNKNLHLKGCLLLRKNEELRKDIQSKHAKCEKVDELTRKLADYEKLHPDTSQMATELSVTMFDLEEASRKNEELQGKVNVLTRKTEELRRVAEPVVYAGSDENEANELMMKLCKTRVELEASKQTNEELQLKVDAFINDVENEVTNELKEKLSTAKFQLKEECRKNEALQTINNVISSENKELRKSKEAAQTDEKEAKKLMIKLSGMASNKLEEANMVNEELLRCNNELLRRLAESKQSPEVDHSCEASVSNIFKPCPFMAPETFSISNVAKMLRGAYFPSDPEWMEKYKHAVKDNIFECNLCTEPASIFMGTAILEHFFTSSHTKKIREHQGTVSLAAFEYWMDKLDKIPIPKPRPSEGTIPKRVRRSTAKEPSTATRKRAPQENDSPVLMLDEDVPD